MDVIDSMTNLLNKFLEILNKDPRFKDRPEWEKTDLASKLVIATVIKIYGQNNEKKQ